MGGVAFVKWREVHDCRWRRVQQQLNLCMPGLPLSFTNAHRVLLKRARVKPASQPTESVSLLGSLTSCFHYFEGAMRDLMPSDSLAPHAFLYPIWLCQSYATGPISGSWSANSTCEPPICRSHTVLQLLQLVSRLSSMSRSELRVCK